jgi:hypothetical protein
MAKNPSPQQILSRLFEENKRSNKLEVAAQRLSELAEGVIREDLEKAVGGESVEFHEPFIAIMRTLLLAQGVLTLNSDDERDKPLASAFAAANLDPNNIHNWKLLLREFAIAHFAPRRGAGAPLKWPADRYCRLLAQVHQLKVKNPSLKNTRACGLLCKQPEYRQKSGKPLSVDRLRKALREARDPAFNDILSRSLEQNLINARIRRQQENRPWTPEIEAELRKNFTAALTDWIANNWLEKDQNKN